MNSILSSSMSNWNREIPMKTIPKTTRVINWKNQIQTRLDIKLRNGIWLVSKRMISQIIVYMVQMFFDSIIYFRSSSCESSMKLMLFRFLFYYINTSFLSISRFYHIPSHQRSINLVDKPIFSYGWNTVILDDLRNQHTLLI